VLRIVRSGARTDDEDMTTWAFEAPSRIGRSRWRRLAGIVLSLIVTVVLGGGWLVAAGFFMTLGGAFGSVGGWVWSIGYLLVPALIVVALWPFPGRRFVAAAGLLISCVLGLLLAHQAAYTTGRVVQILDNQPEPASSRLVATTTDNNCFGTCANVTRWYLVPADRDEVTAYGRALLADGYKRTIEMDQYAKGQLTIALSESPTAPASGPPPAGQETQVRSPQLGAAPDQATQAPVGSVYLVLGIWATPT
jgi:hypothetical protein